MKILALITHTFRELTAKATLIVLASISTLIIVFVLLAISARETEGGITLLLFGNPMGLEMPLEKFSEFIEGMESTFAGGLFGGLVLFGVFATAGIVPDMLEKGTVDLYLSKPIARWELLLGKYLGAVTVVFANVLYFIGALWLIFGVKLGVWNVQFLLSVFTLTFVFASLYSIVANLGVASRNTAISIIGAFLYLFVVSGLLEHRARTLYLVSENSIYRTFIDCLYYALPQLSSVQDEIKQQITHETVRWEPFLQCLVSSMVIFAGGASILRKRDF